MSHAATLAPAPLRFRAIPWYDRSVQRVIEVAPAHTLSDLHRSLVEELGLDDDHLWAFYLSGEWLDRTSEIGGAPLGDGPAHVTEIGALGLEPGDTVAYLCDFGDEQRVELELLGFGDAADVPARPRVLERAKAWTTASPCSCPARPPTSRRRSRRGDPAFHTEPHASTSTPLASRPRSRRCSTHARPRATFRPSASRTASGSTPG